MKNFIKRLKNVYTLENIKHVYSTRPFATVAAITGDVLIVVAIVAAVVYGISVVI